VATPLRIAHRGYARAGARPNSLDAIGQALAYGCDMVEVDVRRRRDGSLVLDHDSGDRPAAPLLADALGLIRDAGRTVNIDVKVGAVAPELVEEVRAAGMVERTTCTGGCWPALARIHEAEPGIRIGLTIPRRGSRVPRAVRRMGLPLLRLRAARIAIHLCRQYGADLVTMHHGLVSRRGVDSLHAKGIEVWCWTVDEPRELARVREAGVDGICSDRPASHGLSGGLSAPVR
jgi:glycerophosphoryl diester phosphodiesterase